MCGIVGFNFKDENLLRVMTSAVKHRGPDDEGLYSDNGCSLGHRRLSILDLTHAGHQPMVTKDGQYVITYNGEIYNFADLKNDLAKKGHIFTSQTDTEVILAAYKEYGAGCLSKFNGIFAFAIWNTKDRELFLARDRFGVKPLFYFSKNKTFAFASELPALYKVPHNHKELNWYAVNMYFRILYFPGSLTPLKDCFKLPAASYMYVRESGPTEPVRYWEMSDFSDIQDPKFIRQEIRRLFEASVKRQCISDRPVGLFLSGGIDSTAILAESQKHLPYSPHTFSAIFDYENEGDKFNYDALIARKTSKHFHTNHHEIMIRGGSLRDVFSDVVRNMGEPFCNPTVFLSYILAREARNYVPVIFSGDGGDELFGGYPRYRLSLLISRYQTMPKSIQKLFFPVMRRILGDRFNKFSLKELSRYLAIKFDMGADLKSLFKHGFDNANLAEDYFRKNFFSRDIPRDFEKYFMYVDSQTWLIDEALVRSDRMTMAWGVEQRVPLLDHELAEFAMRIPTRFKIHSSMGKYIFRQAISSELPDFVKNLKKRGWFSPAAKWLRSDLQLFARDSLSASYNTRADFFDYTVLSRILNDHIEKKRYNLNLIWALITFQVWYKQLNDEL